MKSLLTVLAVVGFVATGAYGVAGQDSTTWEGSYEADVVPENDGWTIPYPTSDPPNGSVSGGIFSFSDHNGKDWAGYRNDGDLTPDRAKGFSYEIRAKTDVAPADKIFYNTYASGNATFQFRNDASLGAFARFDIGTVSGDANNLYYFTDTTEYHTYRITVTALDGPTANWIAADLYVDDNPIPVDQATNNAAGGWAPWGKSKMDIFPANSPDGSVTSIDWIRWTAEGAFAVPEPASLLILTGGLLALARRRK